MGRQRKPWRGEDYADKGWTPETTRTCTGPCGKTLLATNEYFHVNGNCKFGLCSWCITCVLNRSAEEWCGDKYSASGWTTASEMTCKSCKKILVANPDNFVPSANCRWGLRKICRGCFNAGVRAVNLAAPERRAAVTRNQSLRSKYGLTPEAYSAMAANQLWRCPITAKPLEPPRVGGGQSVDHSHVTGRIRGILNSPANKAIGLLRDDPEACVRAAVYLFAGGLPVVGEALVQDIMARIATSLAAPVPATGAA